MKEKIINALMSVKREGIDYLINYLKESDFFTAPASTKYHSCVPGGLAKHSWLVYELLSIKNKSLDLGLSEDMVIITALLHDLCKIDFYKKGIRNVKENGVWVQKEIWEVDDKFPMGHGEKSVIIINRYIYITDMEKAMIRWHMGFTEPKDSYLNLNNAIKMWPAIIAMHTADLEASYLLEER